MPRPIGVFAGEKFSHEVDEKEARQMVKSGAFTWVPGSGAIRTTQAEAVAGPTESLEPAKRRRMEGSDSRDISASMGPGFIHRYAEESMKPRGQITEIRAALEGIAGHHRGWAPVTAQAG